MRTILLISSILILCSCASTATVSNKKRLQTEAISDLQRVELPLINHVSSTFQILLPTQKMAKSNYKTCK